VESAPRAYRLKAGNADLPISTASGTSPRDVGHSRRVNYPIWATEFTPVTGKWRIETVEINSDIQIAGVRVSPGDIVVADETGVCFIPIDRATEVLQRALKKATFESKKCDAIEAGVAVADLPANA
jgi:4-hydroxy-4-methyl-2-oxoglutarate aldolase